jgi:hypothetical protein
VKKCSPGQESADLNKYKHYFPEHEVVLLFYQNLTFGPLAQKPRLNHKKTKSIVLTAYQSAVHPAAQIILSIKGGHIIAGCKLFARRSQRKTLSGSGRKGSNHLYVAGKTN